MPCFPRSVFSCLACVLTLDYILVICVCLLPASTIACFVDYSLVLPWMLLFAGVLTLLVSTTLLNIAVD